MVRLQPWQWVVLALPIASIVSFVLIAAGWQIHEWGVSWLWGVVTVLLVGWRWLLVRWTQPALRQVEDAIAQVNQELESSALAAEGESAGQGVIPGNAAASKINQAEAALQNVLQSAQSDRPFWEDWPMFWLRCQELVIAIAQIYNPDVKYPLLNIYIPQAYGLIRGTVDDMDQWMQKLSPALGQVTVGQAYQAYEVYRKLEPSARKVLQALGWAQWLLNPVAAIARRASWRYGSRANQQLLVNLSQLLREAALRNLCRQAVMLYSGTATSSIASSRGAASTSGSTIERTASVATPTLPQAQTQTLQELLAQAEPETAIAQKPVNILLIGRTGAGKSSLINTLFQAPLAAVDLLPSTDRIQNYQWQSPQGESLVLWDTPGYEQVDRGDFREQVLEFAMQADLLLLATPALDPALQMDVDFLQAVQAAVQEANQKSDQKSDQKSTQNLTQKWGRELPVITIVTQVDRLRPIREWQPPYDWQWGDRPKENAIREAVNYRLQQLGEQCDRVLPFVAGDPATGRVAWGADGLAIALVEAISPAKQLRLARFLRDREARALAAAQIIDHYTLQMATTQGLTALLKSPVLQFISTVSTGSPTLAYVLAERIPVEQLPVVIGKLQMAYELFNLLQPETAEGKGRSFDLRSLWGLLREIPQGEASPEVSRYAWAWGHALVEYWTQNLTADEMRKRLEDYLKR